ncbi:MAG: response regulator [Candidatus Eremiobacteraeota bacterium]|nr:response regulator [Candidatus Eremiobacteraeota bacterium]
MKSSSHVRPIEILLVEDNAGDADLTREALDTSKMHNRLHVVTDGVEAMDFLHRRGKHGGAPRPDLVLLDLNLPKKDGREVLAEIKADNDLKCIPVVILTTSREEQDVLKSYNLHANCYISKPIDFAQFMVIVKSIEDFWFTIVRLPANGMKPCVK